MPPESPRIRSVEAMPLVTETPPPPKGGQWSKITQLAIRFAGFTYKSDLDKDATLLFVSSSWDDRNGASKHRSFSIPANAVATNRPYERKDVLYHFSVNNDGLKRPTHVGVSLDVYRMDEPSDVAKFLALLAHLAGVGAGAMDFKSWRDGLESLATELGKTEAVLVASYDDSLTDVVELKGEPYDVRHTRGKLRFPDIDIDCKTTVVAP